MLKKNLSHKQLAILTIAIVVSFLTFACQSGNKSGNQAQTTDSSNMKVISENVKEVVYPLPTPFETTKMLTNMGATYNSAILNPVDKAEKYFTEKSKAINFGIYSADLAYVASYDQKQDVKLYSKALKSLVDEMGITIDYSTMLSDEFKAKINNKDTLIKVITKTYYDSYKNMNTKGSGDMAVMMVSGMWVELMYIATNISKDTYNNSEIVKIIANQKDSYNKVLELLGSHNKNEDIKDIETKLLILKTVYEKVDKGLYKDDYILILKTIQALREAFVS